MKRLVAGTVCLVAACAAPAVWWTAADRLRTTGDEPHYLIIAASVLRDGDLDVTNNYEEDARTAEIYGPVEPHATAGRPTHAPGLGILLAVPFALGGPLAARLALCLFAALLAWAVWRGLRDALPAGEARLAAAGLLATPAVLFGASRIYPDLAGGVAATALAVWLWTTPRSARSLAGWSTYWLCTGLLWWLHVKFLAPAAILAAAGAWQIRREREAGAAGPPLAAHLAAASLVLVGPLALGWWHVAAFGSVLGPRAIGWELSSPWLQRAQVFLGLHLDQGQGMFLQQPLLLPGLAALGWMARRRHPLTLPWLLLYASLIVPNALQWSGRFGGGGPAGRFGWSAMWLWIIPLGIWMAAERDTLRRTVRPVVLTALAYQAALAIRWLPEPFGLLSRQSELVWSRHSLFPVSVRYSLPSFYFWESDAWLHYLPNVVWIGGALLLVATGLLWASAARAKLRPVWIGGVALAALLLPVEPTADTESPADDALHEFVARSVGSEIPRRFEAERMFPMSLAADTTRADPRASGGLARGSAPIRPDRIMLFGPYVSLAPGRYRAEVALRLAAPSVERRAARFEITAARARTIVAGMEVPAARLPDDGTWATGAIVFEIAEALRDVEFRVIAYPGVDLLADYVDLTPVLPRPERPQPAVIVELPA